MENNRNYILGLLNEHFGSREKSILWLNSPNPNLGGLKPIEMINYGRVKQLIKFIKRQTQND